MLKTEKIKKEIDVLPADMLNELERFIKSLKARKRVSQKRSPLLSDLSECAEAVDLPSDFSKQHDHYLYGLPKK